MIVRAESVLKTERVYTDYRDCGIWLILPDEVKAVRDRVTVFDRNLDFTQHDVIQRRKRGREVLLSPAIPWPTTEEEEEPVA